jgi:cyclophilin family peptidyl-prolyl cis-trans isomerase
VVFGEITKGMEVLERIEKESKPDEKFVPQIPVVIVNSGVLAV